MIPRKRKKPTISDSILKFVPEGALPIYTSDSYFSTTCFDNTHDGYMKPRSNCSHPSCMVTFVLEE